MAPAFTRYIGVDYSCAQTPEASLNGLRVYCTNGGFATETANAVTVLAVTTHDLIDAQKACPKPGLGQAFWRV